MFVPKQTRQRLFCLLIMNAGCTMASFKMTLKWIALSLLLGKVTMNMILEERLSRKKVLRRNDVKKIKSLFSGFGGAEFDKDPDILEVAKRVVACRVRCGKEKETRKF